MSSNSGISVSYLDQELRKERTLVLELRDTIDKQEVMLADQSQRMASMEDRMAKLQAQLARIPAVEEAMQHVRDEMVLRVNEVERGVQSSLNDYVKTRQSQREHDGQAIRDIQTELDRFNGIEQSLNLRSAEENRLREQLSRLQETVGDAEKKATDAEEIQRRLEEDISRNGQAIAQLRGASQETDESEKDHASRILMLETEIKRMADHIKEFDGMRAELSRERDDLFESVRLNERTRAQTLTDWGRKIERAGHQIDTWSDQMRYYSDQHEKNRRVLQESQELIHGVSQQVDQVRQVQQIESDQQRRALDEARADLERRLAQEADRRKNIEGNFSKVMDQQDGRLDDLETWRKQDVGTVSQLASRLTALHGEAMARVLDVEGVLLDLVKAELGAKRQILSDMEPRLSKQSGS